MVAYIQHRVCSDKCESCDKRSACKHWKLNKDVSWKEAWRWKIKTQWEERLTMIHCWTRNKFCAGWAFHAGISASSGVADARQVVMPEGRTPGRHDGRDAEVRRFSPLPLCRHSSSHARRHSYSYALNIFLFSLSSLSYIPSNLSYR